MNDFISNLRRLSGSLRSERAAVLPSVEGIPETRGATFRHPTKDSQAKIESTDAAPFLRSTVLRPHLQRLADLLILAR